MTTREIAQALPDISQASVYRHIAVLAEAGILYVAEEKPARALTERVYALDETKAYIEPDERGGMTQDDYLRYFFQFIEGLRQTYRRYAAGAGADTDPNRDGVSFYGEVLHLTPEEMDELRKEMRAVTRRFQDNAPRPDRRRFYIGRLTLPDDGATGAES